MNKNVWQITILVLIMSILAILQFSFISALPDPFRQCNLVLIILTFILFFLDFRVALLAALISGFWLDIMSFNFFGFHLLIFFVVLLLAQSILKNWLTNRSFYTLLSLMLGITVFYNLLSAITLYLASDYHYTFFLLQSSFWTTLLYQGMWSLFASLILFNLAALLSRRIKPFFLEKKSYL